MTTKHFTEQDLLEIFPPERTQAFFDALFGDAEEGAYDIRLEFTGEEAGSLNFVFALLQRPGKCLACNLTYGLPQVFSRHPLINVKGVAAEIARRAGWNPDSARFELGITKEHSSARHTIPFIVHQS